MATLKTLLNAFLMGFAGTIGYWVAMFILSKIYG
jgi:hypothetical protein